MRSGGFHYYECKPDGIDTPIRDRKTITHLRTGLKEYLRAQAVQGQDVPTFIYNQTQAPPAGGAPPAPAPPAPGPQPAANPYENRSWVGEKLGV